VGTPCLRLKLGSSPACCIEIFVSVYRHIDFDTTDGLRSRLKLLPVPGALRREYWFLEYIFLPPPGGVNWPRCDATSLGCGNTVTATDEQDLTNNLPMSIDLSPTMLETVCLSESRTDRGQSICLSCLAEAVLDFGHFPGKPSRRYDLCRPFFRANLWVSIITPSVKVVRQTVGNSTLENNSKKTI
jgi:hypothetical protein